MVGFWGKRKREQQQLEQQQVDAQDADLARRAQQALVAADERIRRTGDEIHFAEAELGGPTVVALREALDAVTQHLGEAFQLHQLNHDEIPDTPEELRTRNARIIQLCEWAEQLLDERTEALAERVAAARKAPEILAGVVRDASRLRERIPGAQLSVDRLSARYSEVALRQIARNPAETEQLLSFAEHSADVSRRRQEAGQRDQAIVAMEAATEAIRRAATLLDAVETFEIEALRAESTLAAVIEDSRNDLIDVRTAPQTPAVIEAAATLRAALDALPASGAEADPFHELSTLRAANTALDEVVAKARERALRPAPTVAQVQHAADDADRQLAVVRDLISGHRGWIGADARTRLAEAERVRSDLDALVGGSIAVLSTIDEDQREQALAMARRSAFLASEALDIAQRDIDNYRASQDPRRGGYDDGWGGGRGGMGGGGMGGIGSILGGIAIGSILGDMLDG